MDPARMSLRVHLASMKTKFKLISVARSATPELSPCEARTVHLWALRATQHQHPTDKLNKLLLQVPRSIE
jgi:hypothetical protein